MSIKLMSHVWETATVSGSDMLVLLALADYGNDQGDNIYPSMQSLASKARLSVDQTRRVIHKLIADGVIELVEAGGWKGNRNRPNEYRIVLGGTGKLQAPCADASTGAGVDARGGTRADASTVLAPMQDDPSVNHQLETPEQDDDDDTRTRTPIELAWFETYGAELPENLTSPITNLVGETSAAAVIHGIRASTSAKSRSFRFIAECARNYIPPVLANGYANGYGAASYHVDPPDADEFQPAIHPLTHMPYVPPPPPPLPLPADDPWAIVLAELARELPSGFLPTLEGSSIEAAGMVTRENGTDVPLYRVLITPLRAANGLNHFTKQAGVAIRRKLGTVLGHPVQVDIVAAEAEQEAKIGP